MTTACSEDSIWRMELVTGLGVSVTAHNILSGMMLVSTFFCRNGIYIMRALTFSIYIDPVVALLNAAYCSVSQCHACHNNGYHTLTSHTQRLDFWTHGYPTTHYANSIDCRWQIHAPGAERIRVYLTGVQVLKLTFSSDIGWYLNDFLRHMMQMTGLSCKFQQVLVATLLNGLLGTPRCRETSTFRPSLFHWDL